MDLHNWRVKFRVKKSVNDSISNTKEYSEIVNWLNDNEPVGFLSFRETTETGNFEMIKIEFGYYVPSEDKWLTKHSDAFPFLDGNYIITCRKTGPFLSVSIERDGNQVIKPSLISVKDFRSAEKYFLGDVLKRKKTNVDRISIK